MQPCLGSPITPKHNSLLFKCNLSNHANTCAIRHGQFARVKTNTMITSDRDNALLVGLSMKGTIFPQLSHLNLNMINATSFKTIEITHVCYFFSLDPEEE